MDKKKFEKLIKDNPFASYSDLVYDDLFNRIITMKLLPGEKINSAQIASTLNISRSPVQAAINRLIEDYLIVKPNNKQPIVAPLTLDDAFQIIEVRKFIEGYAGYTAAMKISSEQIKKLKSLAKKYEKISSDPETKGYEVCDHEFHSTIIEASGNIYLIQMYQTIERRVLRYRYYLRHRFGDKKLQTLLHKNTIKSHWTICNALELGFAETVKDELIRHNDSMRDAFVLL